MQESTIHKHTQLIKSFASQLGFSFCGISQAGFLEEEAPRLEHWLNQQMHGEMAYMANYFDKRLDPTKLVEGAKSVISLVYNYYPEKDLARDENFKVAKYAYGEDYHLVIREILKELMARIQEDIGEVNGRIFVDSAPVLERVWAKKSGLGWVGKNSLLLNKSMGSFFFLAEIVLDLELEVDGPVKDYCGSCTQCIDACPTDAIPSPYVVDGSKCISYFTIELKDEIPYANQEDFKDWIFGCDICQDVCPWNRFAKSHQEEKFKPLPSLVNMRNKDWEELTEEVFNDVFKNSPLKRSKYRGLKRNVKFLKEGKQ